MLIHWQKTIVDRRGNVQPGAVLTIRRESDQALVKIYRDREGNEPYPTGTVTADENGYAHFYAPADTYRITSTQPAIDWRDEGLTIATITFDGRTYVTAADMIADQSQPIGTLARVSTGEGAGDYVMTAAGWVWSDVQPASASELNSVSALATGADTLATSIVSENLYSEDAVVFGKYVRLADGLFADSVEAAVVFVPVVPGQTYDAIGTDLTPNRFLGAFVPKAEAVNPPIGLATMEQIDGGLSFSVPSDPSIRYVAINVVLIGWDVRGDFTLQMRIDRSLPDYQARSSIDGLLAQVPVVAADVSTTEPSPVNLYDSQNDISGIYTPTEASSNPNKGKIQQAAGAVMGVFPVSPGVTYRLTAESYPDAVWGLILKANDDPADINSVNGLEQLEIDGASRLLVVPQDSPAKFAFLNVVIQNWDIRGSLEVVSLGEVRSLLGMPLADSKARSDIARLIPFRGKKWTVIGDSITEKNFRANKNYHDFVAEWAGGMAVVNLGDSGTGYFDRHGVVSDVPADTDLITVFLGTNDWGNTTLPLGQYGDSATDTICGCIDTLLSSLVEQFFSTPIGVVTPIPRLTSWGDPGQTNSREFSLKQLSELIARYAAKYSLPVLDLYKESGLTVYTAGGNALYFTAPGQPSPDGLHPNDAGQEVLAWRFSRFLPRIYHSTSQ